MPVAPAFALPPQPTRPLLDLTRKGSLPDIRPQLHGEAAPGYELQAVMRETSSVGSACELGFQVADIGARSFQSFTINLAVAIRGQNQPRSSEIPLVELLQPNHSITAHLKLGVPCAAVEEVRLRAFSRCVIDNVPVGDCRPPMLMRSISRIAFGL